MTLLLLPVHTRYGLDCYECCCAVMKERAEQNNVDDSKIQLLKRTKRLERASESDSTGKA